MTSRIGILLGLKTDLRRRDAGMKASAEYALSHVAASEAEAFCSAMGSGLKYMEACSVSS